MGNLEEVMQIVRAAFQPGADAATREQAAMILRSALAVLDAKPGAALVPVGAPPSVTSGADLLGALIERLRPLLPAGAETAIPRLSIPLVPVGKP